MFDCNQFKRSVKDWMRKNPNGQLQDLVDYCEDLIPTGQYPSHKWLVDQTISWYKHVLTHRDVAEAYEEDEDERLN